MTILQPALDQFLGAAAQPAETMPDSVPEAPTAAAEPLPATEGENPFAPLDLSEGEKVAGLGSIFGKAGKAARVSATAAKAAADDAARKAAMPAAAKAITPKVADDIAAKTVVAGPKTTPPPAPLTKPPVDVLNYLRTGLPEDPNRFLDETAKAIGITAPSKVSYADEIAKLQGMGFKSKDIEWIAGYADNTQQMTQVAKAREILVAAARKAHELATKVVANQTDMKLAAEYHQATQFLGVVTRGVKNMTTDYARAFGIMRMDPVGDVNALAELVENVGGMDSIVAHAQKLAKVDITNPANIAKVAKLAEAGMWSKLKDAWVTTWINGLLSSPVTHAKNVFGNEKFALMQIPERGVAAMIGKGDNLLRYMKGMPARETAEYEEVMAMISGHIQGSLDGMATAARAFKENKPVFGMSNKMEVNHPQVLTGEAWGLSGYTAKAMDFYGAMVTMPGRALMAEDEFFKVVNYSMELHAQASRKSAQAYRSAIEQGMSAVDAEKIAAKVRIDILDTPPPDIDAAAMSAARINTFTQPLEQGTLGAKVAELANNNLIVKMHLPFVRTPLNIVDQTLQRTPFAPISKAWRDDVAAGGIRRDLALAKMATGTTILSAFSVLAASGMITGGGPGKGGTDDNLRRSGWRPYSFVLPAMGAKDVERLQNKFGRDNVVVGTDKTYVSYQGIEPIGGMLAMVADTAEYARWQDDVSMVEEVTLGAAFGLANYTSTLPYLQTIGEFAALVQRMGDTTNKPKELLDFIGKQAGSFAIGGSPAGIGSSAQAAVERIIDPTLSQTREPKSTLPFVKGFYEALNTYRSRVPGLSDELPPKLDRWANPIKAGEGNWWELFSPIRVSAAGQTEADRVLLENRVNWKMPARDMSWQGGKGPFTGLHVEMTNEQYNELLTIYAKEIKIGGNGVQDAIVAASRDPAFERLALGERQMFLKKIDDEYMKAARQTLFMRYEQDFLRQFEAKRNTVEAYGYNTDELKR